MSLFRHSPHNSTESQSVVSRSWLHTPEKITWRHYSFAAVGALLLAGGILIFAASPPPPLYSGKLLGMNASFGDLPASQTSVLTQLGVNSERGELDLDGSSFSDPSYDGTSANWVDTLTTNHIVPLPLLNQYVEIQTVNAPAFAAATVSWCKVYCAGGSFYTGNSQANGSYAPQTLEILNEPYGNWWGYPVTTTDIAAYASLLQDIRTNLNNAGLNNIGILAATNNNDEATPNWDTDLLNDGGLSAVQGVTVHAYGDSASGSNYNSNGSLVIPSGAVSSGVDGWQRIYYVHQFLANAGLSTQANNLYITEDGWCTAVGGDCSGSEVAAEQVKDQNIGTAISQLATVPWIKGFWYFNLHPYGGNSWGLYDSSGNKTPAWAAFQQAATTTEAQNSSEFSLSSSTIPPPPTDTTPPTVSISSPVSGATVTGTTTLAANAADNIGVASVQFKLDGTVLGATTTSPYSYSWDTTKALNGTHTLTAVASDAAGNATTSSSVTVTVSNKTIDTTPPSAPSSPIATALTSAQVNLSWGASTDNVGVTSYKIYRNGSTTALATVAAPATAYQDSAVSAGTTYTYTITALDAAGNQSAHSISVSTTTPAAADKTAPSVPTGLTSTTQTSTTISLSWNASTDNTGGSGLAGYHLYRNGTLIASPTGTSYVDSGLTTATSYSYTVSAYDKAANGSAASGTVVVKTAAPPPDTTTPSVPTGLTASAVSSAEIDLGWKASTDNVGVTGYKLYRNGSTTPLTTVNAPATSYRDVAVSAGTGYSYTVTAIDAAGNQSAHSASVGTSTPAATDKTAPSVPTGLASGAITTTTVALSWNSSADNAGGSGLAGYHLYRNGTLIASPTGTTYTDTGLSPGTSYSYSVAAYDKAANGSVASSAVAVKTITPVTASSVQNLVWNPSTNTLSWSVYPGAYGYKIATVHNPTTIRNTDYIYPPVTGIGWKPPALKGETVHYGIIPEIKNANGSYADMPGTTWSPEITVTWPSAAPAPTPTRKTHQHHWWQIF